MKRTKMTSNSGSLEKSRGSGDGNVPKNNTPGSRRFLPDWSEETLTALDKLTELQRACVEWYVYTGNGADSYRRAHGLEPTAREFDTSRKQWNKISGLPKVQEAIRLARIDRSRETGVDRNYILRGLKQKYEGLVDDRSIAAALAGGNLLMKMAMITGNIATSSEC